MHYYIDGYNLLFRLLRVGNDIRKQREELTFTIEKKISLLELDVTLVFDSHYQEDESTRSHLNSLEIIFTGPGETADEYILEALKESSNPLQHTVVTSDKKLARLCQLRLSKTESVEEFLAWTSKRYKNKLRQRKLQTSPPSEKISAESRVSPPRHTIPTSQDISQNFFNYYLDFFESEFKELENQTPPPKKPEQPPKKPKIKKRQLTKEETQLSDMQRWQKTFEKNTLDDSDNFVY